ncbi:MAG: right-handed parallel beta-helix repeat-containing protein [Anaerolineae bacterium]|jgi:hypothetical protein
MIRRPGAITGRLLTTLLLGCGLAAGFLALSAAAATDAATAVHYVAPGGACGGATPCHASLQDAVDAAAAGDEIRVASGTYTGVLERDDEVQLAYISKTVDLRGGYVTTNWSDANPEAHSTTLDAQWGGRAFTIIGDISVTIEGFEIVRGFAVMGGGIYAEDAEVSLIGNQIADSVAQGSGPFDPGYGGGVYLKLCQAEVRGNRLEDNSANGGGWYSGGGGLYADRSSLTLDDNLFQSNTTLFSSGGGAHIRRSTATLLGNAFVSNTADSRGAGLFLNASEGVQLAGNRMTGNTCYEWGGGVSVYDSDASLIGDSITDNTAYDGGAGLFLDESDVGLTNSVVADNQSFFGTAGIGLHAVEASARLVHATFARNTGGAGNGIRVSPGSLWVTNTVVVSHAVGVFATAGSTATLNGVLWYSNTTAGYAGDGSFTVNHAITGTPAFAADGYHVMTGSAAIDAGVMAGVGSDVDHEPRFGIPDLGVDEYWAQGALKRVYLPVEVREG